MCGMKSVLSPECVSVLEWESYTWPEFPKSRVFENIHVFLKINCLIKIFFFQMLYACTLIHNNYYNNIVNLYQNTILKAN